MGYVMPKIVVAATSDRAKRLSVPSPTLRRNSKIYAESAERLIKPLYTASVNYDHFDYCMHVLEQIYDTSESQGDHLRKCIESNIINGITTEALNQINLDKYNIPDNAKESLMESLYLVATSQRILTNQDRLAKRFNVDKVVRENVYKPTRMH